jgi:uncharacterized cysteine cluster protein YcgN (CxxCxxCC family)
VTRGKPSRQDSVAAAAALPFWRNKSLSEMTVSEWESLCDRCGKCCLHKLQDDDTGELAYTNVACRLLDIPSGSCRHYSRRTRFVPDCITLTPGCAGTFGWLPNTCAYRLVAEGKNLPHWHPLVSGDPLTVQRAGMSVRNWAISEHEARDIEEHVIQWRP